MIDGYSYSKLASSFTRREVGFGGHIVGGGGSKGVSQDAPQNHWRVELSRCMHECRYVCMYVCMNERMNVYRSGLAKPLEVAVVENAA